MVNLQQQQNQFIDANIKTVVIVMAEPEEALNLVKKYRLTYPVLCDPLQKAYHLYEIPQGRPIQYIGPRTWFAGLRAMIRAGIGKPSYDIKQMHGTVVVTPSAEIIYKHIGKHSADYTPLSEVLSLTK